MTKPQLSAFAKSLMRSYNGSKGGTKSAQKMNVNHPDRLRQEIAEQGTKQTIKDAAWRE